MTDTIVHSTAAMGTVVTIELAGLVTTDAARDERQRRIGRALEWFVAVEATCSRFDPSSELRRLCDRPGEAVPCSDLLFEVVQFALQVAHDSAGAFDPTVGGRMAARGFDRDFRTGRAVAGTSGVDASYRDVTLDHRRRTIRIGRPLQLDLGAVAKGLAVDMAVRELAPLRDFVVDAGGDLYASGHRADGAAWTIGIRHPREQDRMLATLHVTDRAVCTSGDYERAGASGHHILEPGTGDTATGVSSVTVLAPTAIVSDALATAAFVLGPAAGRSMLERHGVDGLIVSSDLELTTTAGFPVSH